MLYRIILKIASQFDIAGSGLFRYISFRAAAAFVIGLLITLFFGHWGINWLRKKQIGEEIRDLGVEAQMKKKGTPTMGGVIIISAILVAVLLLCDLGNIYVQLLLFSTIALCALGFLDDVLKYRKHNKDGVRERYKLVWQFCVGLIIALCMYSSKDVKICESKNLDQIQRVSISNNAPSEGLYIHNTTKTTIPFFKYNELDYSKIIPIKGRLGENIGWLIYVCMIIFVVMAVSNGANITDGMDGMVSGISAIILVVLGIFAYLSGNIIYAGYLNIMYIPHAGEVAVFMAAVIGALIGFLWFNSYPAQVFMGDTGSQMLGGIIAVAAIVLRKELMLPLLCGIFLVESVTVLVQRWHFRKTRRKTGNGIRIFRCTPVHHHFEKTPDDIQAIIKWPKHALTEPKIVARFWIISLLLAALTIITLKIR